MPQNSYGPYSTITFGVGVPAFTGVVLSASEVSRKPNVSVTVENESGRAVFELRDDVTSTLKLNASIITGSNGGAIPTVGSTITYNTTLSTGKYIVEGTTIKFAGKNTCNLDIEGKQSEYITLP